MVQRRCGRSVPVPLVCTTVSHSHERLGSPPRTKHETQSTDRVVSVTCLPSKKSSGRNRPDPGGCERMVPCTIPMTPQDLAQGPHLGRLRFAAARNGWLGTGGLHVPHLRPAAGFFPSCLSDGCWAAHALHTVVCSAHLAYAISDLGLTGTKPLRCCMDRAEVDRSVGRPEL